MGRLSILVLIAAAIAGWIALQRFEIRGLRDIELVRRDGTKLGGGGVPAAATDRDSIRIASFNLHAFGPAKADHPAVMEILARVIREFDVVAVQEISSSRPDVLRSLMDRVNETGRHYSILAGPQVGRTSQKEQYAYIYDQSTLETDRDAAYTVDDPDDVLHNPPLVGCFRVRGPQPEEAFTFSLVNVHTDPDETSFETKQLSNVFYAVRDDGRCEDDLIMLGDFNADDQQLGSLNAIPDILAAIAATPTNTRQTEQFDNLVFQLSATSEYAGRCGVFDFMRKFNLTLEQALQVSDHLPVWAEFSKHEGGSEPAVVAAQGAARVR